MNFTGRKGWEVQILLRLTLAIEKKKKAVFQCDSIFPFIGGSEPPPTSQEEFNKLTVCINN